MEANGETLNIIEPRNDLVVGAYERDGNRSRDQRIRSIKSRHFSAKIFASVRTHFLCFNGVPEWSEYVDERRVRHLWECEACAAVARLCRHRLIRNVSETKFSGVSALICSFVSLPS
jgi:hypothetical protein